MSDCALSGILTDDEHRAIALAGELYTHIVSKVLARGETFEDDSREIRHHVHDIQHAIMAQAAARHYPDKYRRLGLVVGQRCAPAESPVTGSGGWCAPIGMQDEIE